MSTTVNRSQVACSAFRFVTVDGLTDSYKWVVINRVNPPEHTSLILCRLIGNINSLDSDIDHTRICCIVVMLFTVRAPGL